MTGKTHLGRLFALALLAAGSVAAWRWRGLFDPLALPALIGGNPMAPLVFLALHVAGSLFFVPRTLLALGAGLVFGMWWGILWAALGSLAGAVAGFLDRALHPFRVRRSADLGELGSAGPAGGAPPARRARRLAHGGNGAAGADHPA